MQCFGIVLALSLSSSLLLHCCAFKPTVPTITDFIDQCFLLSDPRIPPDQLISKLKLEQILVSVAGQIKGFLVGDGSPGGAVFSLVYRDKVIWTKGFGLKNMSDTNLGPPDENTRFRIGSITKLFTALQTLMMRDSGKIRSLDDDITLYYPDFKVKNPFQTERGVTFRQLMSHMSGLARNAPCKGIFETGCNISDAEMNQNIAGMELMFPPGQQPAYSNLGFGLLGKVLAKIAQAPSWDSLLSKMILQPLAMGNTGNSYESVDAEKTAIGYYPDGRVADFIDIGWDSAAGQSYSSTADLAKLMTLIFSDNKSSSDQLVDGETLREWLQPAYVYLDGTGYSYPWELQQLPNTTHSKDGVINGYNAEFRMAAKSKLGFILLQSCDGCKSHRHIIDLAEKLLFTISIGFFLEDPPPYPNTPEEYKGIFAGAIAGEQVLVNISLQLFFNAPTLYIDGGNISGVLQWREEDTFQIAPNVYVVDCAILSNGVMGALVYFQRGSGGKVISLTIPGLVYGQAFNKR